MKFLKYEITAAFFLLLIVSFTAEAQVPTNGDYRTKADGSWFTLSNWQVRSGGVWIDAVTLPGPTNNVYIQANKYLTITSPVSVKDVHIHTTGRITVGNILNIYGKLRCYTGTDVSGSTDGVFYSSQASSTAVGLTLRGGSEVHFKGTTRNITNTGEWSSSGLISPDVFFELNAGNTATIQTSFYASKITVNSGIVNYNSNTIFLPAGAAGNGILTVNANGTLISSNTGTANTNCIINEPVTGNPPYQCNVYGKLVLNGATPYIRIENLNLYPGSILEYGGATQAFLMSSYPSLAAVSTYRNLILSGSGNKTPSANFDVNENITISGSAVLVMGSKTANITGNWTSYGQAGLSEGTSTINFDSTGAQSLNTTGGENFYIMRKSNTGTLTLNSAVNIIAGGNLNMQAGIIDANANTFGGTATSAFNMSGGTIKLAKLSTTLPEFLITPYNLTGGTIELDGAGIQTLRGARDYRNLTFSNSGTKGITSAINNITGTITVSGSVVLDVLNNTMGGTGTNLTMSGTSVYRTAGSSQVKPDAAGTYTLGSGTTVEFNNNLAGLESIRLVGASTVNYAKIIVSGTSVGTASLATGIRFQSGGSFTVKTGAIFKQINTTGFSGSVTTSINSTNSPSIILEPGSTIEYNGDAQTITNQTINTPSTAHYENLLLSGTGNKTAPSGTLNIKGDLTKSVTTTTFVHNAGTVVMNGTAVQDYTSTWPGIKFYNFTNNNTVDLSINSEMSVVKELAFGANSKLNLQSGCNIILVSDNSGTANVGIIPSTATISYIGNGKFTAERYIPTGVLHAKSWQFLAIPTNGGQTINQAWQDTATAANQNRYTGYGTQLTSNISPLPSLFDVLTSAGPSIKLFDTATNSWKGISNTTTISAYNKKGYMVFVRGDRSVTTAGGAAVPTNLRSSGRIFHPVSNIPPVTNIGNTKFESVGNPYASAIDFSNDAAILKSANVQRVFYVWDPNLGGGYGYGAFQTFTKGAGADINYYVSPGGGSYGPPGSVNNFIQSGQAFFVRTFGGAGTVTFSENAKVNSNSLTFRPATPHNPVSQLRNNLFIVNNSTPLLLDGVLDQFHRAFNNSIDMEDAFKLGNTGESISIVKSDSELSVERRGLITETDTLFYKLSGLRLQQYEFEFVPTAMDWERLEAFLEDKFLETKTPVNLKTPTRIRFEVINNPGSYASNRFMLVFKRKNSCEENPHLIASLVPGSQF